MAALLAPWLSGLTLLASTAFAALVTRRWLGGRRRHQLLWAASLALFAGASAMELLAALQGWSTALYKLYFVVTAVMVGLMAAGTGYLLSRNLGNAFTAYVAVVAQAMTLFVAFAPADAARLALAGREGLVPTRVLGGVGVLHALLDIPAAALLVGGALQSWRRTRAGPTLLIATGAAVFTGVHSLASGAQTGLLSLSGADLFSAGSLAGVLLLFAGYVKSREAPQPGVAQAVPALG